MIFPDGLRSLNLLIEVQHDHFPEDTDDATILAECGRRGWVYVSQDRRVRKNPAELEAMRAAGIHAIFVHGANRSAAWTVGIFKKSLRKIVEALASASSSIQIIVTSDDILVIEPDAQDQQ